jgi:hypothetical protein
MVCCFARISDYQQYSIYIIMTIWSNILVTNIRTSFIVIVLNIFCLHITFSIIIIIMLWLKTQPSPRETGIVDVLFSHNMSMLYNSLWYSQNIGNKEYSHTFKTIWSNILVTNIRNSFIVIVLNIFCLHITVSIIIIIMLC